MSTFAKSQFRPSLNADINTPTNLKIPKSYSVTNFMSASLQNRRPIMLLPPKNKTTLVSPVDSVKKSHNLYENPFKPRRLPKLTFSYSSLNTPEPTSITEKTSSSRRAKKIPTQPPTQFLVKNHVISATYKSRTGEINGINKPHNQDSFIVRPALKGVKGQYLFSICDGHGAVGHHVSQYIKENLPKIIDTNFNLQNPDMDQISQIMQISVSQLTSSIENSRIDLESSGSTLNSLLISGDKLVCANIGDSRAVLGVYKER